jgi:hypothetical protein
MMHRVASSCGARRWTVQHCNLSPHETTSRLFAPREADVYGKRTGRHPPNEGYERRFFSNVLVKTEIFRQKERLKLYY